MTITHPACGNLASYHEREQMWYCHKYRVWVTAKDIAAQLQNDRDKALRDLMPKIPPHIQEKKGSK